MTFDLKQYSEDFLIAPLGGAGEVGMNVTVFHSGGKFIVVDLGVGFSDQDLPGTDLIVADIGFVVRNRSNLLGIVLTHAHEDHFGAIQYLWEELQCPVYATPFTAAFLRAKLAAARMDSPIPIHEVSFDQPSLDLDPFKVTFFKITHSIPDCCCLLIEAQGLRIFHSGDWKLDDFPVIMERTDTNALKEVGDKGVDLFLCDSTNVFNTEKSGNEGDLVDNFRVIFDKAEGGAIFATMFASNIARIQTVANAAREIGRKIIVLGGAIIRAIEAAKSVGYLTDIGNIYSVEEADNFKREELLILCTGCQGEPMASMSKIITGKYPSLAVCKSDTVVFSSAIIPGNELRVWKIMNALVATGASLFFGKNAHIHVSGHPGQPEMKKMYELLRPNVSVPIHGEHMHMRNHAEFAIEWGSKASMVISNGDVIRVTKQGADVVGKVKHGKYAIDGRFFRAPNSEVMQVRRNLMGHGIVFAVVLLCADTGRLLTKPTVIAPGLLDSKHDQDIVGMIVAQLDRDLSNKQNMRVDVVRSVVFSIIKRICQKRINKYPEIRVHVEKV